MEVLRARAVRAGRTVATYAERLAPLPPPLAVQRVGTWSLERRGEQAWLSLADRGAAVGGRSLLVTAACCRRALPEGRPALATGAAWVGPLRPPLWPSAVAAAARPAGDLLAVVAPAFGRPDVAGFVRRCDAAPVAVDLPAGRAHGIEWRLTVDPGGLSPDDVYLLVRVLDHAFATAGPVDGFTRVTAVTIAGDGVAECPPRAGKGALPGPVVPGPSVVPPDRASAPPGATVATRSGRQAAAVARVFAAVTRPTSVTALGALLRYLLDVPVRVLPFQAARAEVEASARFRLGRGGRVLGRRQACWGVRVVLGPLDRRTFDRFGPGTRASRRVRLLIVGAVGAACPVEVEPVLRADLATPWQLGHGRLGRSLRLGGGAVS